MAVLAAERSAGARALTGDVVDGVNLSSGRLKHPTVLPRKMVQRSRLVGLRCPMDCKGDCVAGQLLILGARFDAGYYELNAIYGGEAESHFTCFDAYVPTSQSVKLAARCLRVSTAAL
jgi:hypothetical protein